MKKIIKVISMTLAALLISSAAVNAATNMYQNSDFVETEQPELSEETKQLISQYQKNPTEENYNNLKYCYRNYNAVLARKGSKTGGIERKKQAVNPR